MPAVEDVSGTRSTRVPAGIRPKARQGQRPRLDRSECCDDGLDEEEQAEKHWDMAQYQWKRRPLRADS